MDLEMDIREQKLTIKNLKQEIEDINFNNKAKITSLQESESEMREKCQSLEEENDKLKDRIHDLVSALEMKCFNLQASRNSRQQRHNYRAH